MPWDPAPSSTFLLVPLIVHATAGFIFLMQSSDQKLAMFLLPTAQSRETLASQSRSSVIWSHVTFPTWLPSFHPGRPRLRKIKSLIQDHTDTKWQILKSNSQTLDTSPPNQGSFYVAHHLFTMDTAAVKILPQRPFFFGKITPGQIPGVGLPRWKTLIFLWLRELTYALQKGWAN